MFIDRLKKLFILDKTPLEKPLKTLKELDIFDDVWVEDENNDILKGWVFDINKKHIFVTIPLENGMFLDYRFVVTRPLNQTQLNQNNKILYFNKPCKKETQCIKK